MLGFMEQTCADAVSEALTEAGLLRPKYPFLTPQQSVLIYIALSLKSTNPM